MEKIKENKKYLLLILLGFVVVGMIVTTMIVVIKNQNTEEPLYIYWDHGQLNMDIGETVTLRYSANKELDSFPMVVTEGSAVVIDDVEEGFVKIRAVEAGADVITLLYEDLQVLCLVSVRQEIFKFNSAQGIIALNAKEKFGITIQPDTLLQNDQIRYFVEDREIVAIVSASNQDVELAGLKKGITVVNAEWRGKTTGMMIEVFEDIRREIIVPYAKQYLNVGQETRLTFDIEEPDASDYYYFEFELESGKKFLEITGKDNVLTVKGLKKGIQFVKINHPKARSPKIVTFDVSSPELPKPPQIGTSESPMILRKNQTKALKMRIDHGSGQKDGFTYKIIENDYAIDIVQELDNLIVTGVAPGAAKIRIDSPYVLDEIDVMVIIE